MSRVRPTTPGNREYLADRLPSTTPLAKAALMASPVDLAVARSSLSSSTF